jgi:haloalkane dehalogenase
MLRPLLAAAALLTVAACASPPPAADLPLRADALRTPDARFENLPEYPFEPNYVAIDGYRVHYVDEGPRDADPVLMLHGEPSWSYLYRKMIPPVAAAGHRVIAPDLIGFGRSDKPKDIATHSYAFHVEAMTRFIEAKDLRDITLVVQDWGSLIGLRVAAENPERFARIVLANGALPTGSDLGPGFAAWKRMAEGFRTQGDMPIGQLVGGQHGAAVAAAYDAPFPDPSYKAGPLAMPFLVPVTPDDPAVPANLRAWSVFETWQKPFLTAFSDNDPVTRGGDVVWQTRVPGAKGQPHTTIKGAGHFLQEDKGEELAQVVIDFIARTR